MSIISEHRMGLVAHIKTDRNHAIACRQCNRGPHSSHELHDPFDIEALKHRLPSGAPLTVLMRSSRH